MTRILIYGNSGSGKSTLARRLHDELGAPVLDLDTITWEPGQPGVPLSEAERRRRLDDYLDTHPEWIVEGAYGDLIAHAAPRATELIFMNPGVEACLANNRRRPWEPHKYADPAEQEARLEFLQKWVRDYYSRDDEYSLARHRQIFDTFTGTKREMT